MNDFPQDPGPAPKASMPPLRFLGLRALAGLLDFLKAACVSIVFLAPFIVGVSAAAITYGALKGVVGEGVASSLAVMAGVGATALSDSAEIAVAPITAAIEGTGVFLAILIGLAGWILIALILFFSGGFNPLGSGGRHFLILFAGFTASVTPFVDAFPTFTPALWKITADMRQEDARKRAAWERAGKQYAAARAAQQDRAEATYAAALPQPSRAIEEEAVASPEPLFAREKSPPLVGIPAYGF